MDNTMNNPNIDPNRPKRNKQTNKQQTRRQSVENMSDLKKCKSSKWNSAF